MNFERLICRTIGCTSPFAWFSPWPHRFICTPIATRGLKKDYGINMDEIDPDFFDAAASEWEEWE